MFGQWLNKFSLIIYSSHNKFLDFRFTMKKKVSLEEMREIQLNILDKIDRFCQEKKLRYSLGGGTLLGAIRHKGYIPWDDDIDIMMPRPDYEVFLECFGNKYEHLVLQHYKNSRACLKIFAKVFDDRTVLLEKNQKCGVYVDVFPIDGLPSIEQLPSFVDEITEATRWLWRTTNVFSFDKNLLRFAKFVIRRFFGPSRRTVVERLDSCLMRYPFESSKFAGAIVGRYVEKEHMEAHVFKSFIDVPFENRMYKAIEEYDAYLRKHYGDYMKLPPKEQQVSNHDYNAWWK